MKRLLTYLLLTIMLAFSASAAASLSFSDTVPAVLAGNPGTEISYTYNVTNDGSEDLSNVKLVTSNLIHKVDASKLILIQQDWVVGEILTGATKIFSNNPRLNIASDQYAGTYEGTIEVYNGTDKLDTMTIEVTVNENPALSITASDIILLQGESGSIDVVLTNLGNTDLQFNYNQLDFEMGLNDLPFGGDATMGNLNIDYDESHTLTFDFNVLTTQTAGDYLGNFTIPSGDVIAHKEINVEVKAPSSSLSVNPSSIDFGTVDRSYDNDVVRETFTITNDGDTTITNVLITHDLSSDYTATLDESSFTTLAPGASEDVELEIEVPDDTESGNVVLGQITIASDQLSDIDVDVVAEVKSMLLLKDLDVTVVKDTKDYDDGETIKNVKPRNMLKFKAEVENLFDDSDSDTDITIEYIVMTITIENIDDGDDFDVDSEEFDIKADDADTIEMEFDIPSAVDEGTYDVIIEIEGEDENYAVHKETWNLELEIERNSHELKFEKVDVDPEKVSCGRNADLEVKIVNLGRNEEDEVVMTLVGDSLDFSVTEDIGDMSEDPDDDDNDFRKTYQIDTDDIPAGTHRVYLKLYRDEDVLEDATDVAVLVEICKDDVSGKEDDTEEDDTEEKEKEDTTDSESGSEEGSGEEIELITTPVTGSGDGVTAMPIVTKEKLAGTSMFYVVLLAVGNIGLIIMILVLIARAIKR